MEPERWCQEIGSYMVYLSRFENGRWLLWLDEGHNTIRKIGFEAGEFDFPLPQHEADVLRRSLFISDPSTHSY